MEATLGSCLVKWDGRELLIENRNFVRRWSCQDGRIRSISFLDKAMDLEWVASRPGDLGDPAPTPPPFELGALRATELQAKGRRLLPMEEKCLVADLRLDYEGGPITHRFRVFEDSRGVLMQCRVPRNPGSADDASPADGRSATADCLERLEIPRPHLRFTQVILADRTDIHNELVHGRSWLLHPNESDLLLPGNLFILEDTTCRAGLILLKHAPLPQARPVRSEFDALVHCRGAVFRPDEQENPMAYGVSFHGHGIGAAGGWGYPYALLSYGGGRAGRIRALQGHQRLFRTYNPDLDGLLLSNTWGDRSQDRRIRDSFIRREIEAASRLGVDVLQIDDGWEKGRTLNWSEPSDVWEGFWAVDPDFWEPNPERFPDGLDPLAEEASRRGISLGIWFAPDSSGDFRNWRRDSDWILQMHRDLGIKHFKIDGVKARTRKGEDNLRRMFHKVVRATRGKVVFDLDVTAETRPGYFGLMGFGPIFVENRYTDYHRYWPHHTLRNLWRLSEYIDPLRLRMEFLNNQRNAALYEGDPLAPSRYDPEYLFATVMFCSPLGWFETSNVPEEYLARVAELVGVWKGHRREIFGGLILPIGESPDGTSWTGFASVGPSGHSGYLLIFRETNDRPEWTWGVEGFPDGLYAIEVLAGEGEAEVSDGDLTVRIPHQRGFLLCKLTARRREPQAVRKPVP